MDFYFFVSFFLAMLFISLGVVLLYAAFNALRPRSKRKRKAVFGGFVYPAAQYERDEGYWRDRLEAARTGVVDAQREYRDTLQDYAKWQGDKAIEEAKQARDAELAAAMKVYRIEADGDNLIPIERDNKLLAYLRQLTDEDSN